MNIIRVLTSVEAAIKELPSCLQRHDLSRPLEDQKKPAAVVTGGGNNDADSSNAEGLRWSKYCAMATP
ncbi:hypothetical protein BBP40_003371 [Aspergillus hancockii]|nr:hypothetical protein BBP40_003371 [Aspergillus hancockii]